MHLGKISLIVLVPERSPIVPDHVPEFDIFRLRVDENEEVQVVNVADVVGRRRHDVREVVEVEQRVGI